MSAADPLLRLVEEGVVKPATARLARFAVRRFDGDADLLPVIARLLELGFEGQSLVRIEELAAELQIEQDVIAAAADWLDRAMVWAGPADEQRPAPARRRPNGLYLGGADELEQRIAAALLARAVEDPVEELERAKRLIGALDREPRAPNRLQRRAIALAARRRLVLLAGGPGTGKTFTVAHMLRLLWTCDPGRSRTMLLAPTGKAASRLGESIIGELQAFDDPELDRERLRLTAASASTIHRVLFGRGQAGEIQYLEDADLVIVDEMSMVSLGLFDALLAQIPSHARLILIGDPRQLASVEAGTVLADLVRAASRDGVPAWTTQMREALGISDDDPEAVPAAADTPLADTLVVLRESRRFRPDGDIGRLSLALERAGDGGTATDEAVARALSLCAERRTDEPLHPERAELAWLPAESDSAGVEPWLPTIEQLFTPLAHAERVEDALSHLGVSIVLSPVREGPWGTLTLAEWMAARIERQARWAPVIVTHNDYEYDVFNGDLGVRRCRNRDGLLYVRGGTSGKARSIPADEVRFDDAWALTIHKSQGSEFDHVWLFLPPLEGPGAVSERQRSLLTRELLYTGMTRAKKRLTIVGPAETIEHMIRTPIRRASGLVERLRELGS